MRQRLAISFAFARTRVIVTWLVMAATLGAASSATADVEILLGTEFPVTVGATARWHPRHAMRGRVGFELGIGWMPRGYLALINRTATSAGWYEDTTAALIADGLEDSVVMRGGVRVHPLRSRAWSIAAGPALALLGGGISSADAIEAVTGRSFSPEQEREVPLSSTLVAVHASVAWQRRLLARSPWRIHLAIGYFGAVYGTASIDVAARTAVGATRLRDLEAALDSYLRETYQAYIHTATVSVAIGRHW